MVEIEDFSVKPLIYISNFVFLLSNIQIMIESIAITNFYSFNENTKVSFVAGRERNKVSDELYCGFSTQNRVNLLKMVFLYGDNGAGKSKLLLAFDILQQSHANVKCFFVFKIYFVFLFYNKTHTSL